MAGATLTAMSGTRWSIAVLLTAALVFGACTNRDRPSLAAPEAATPAPDASDEVTESEEATGTATPEPDEPADPPA